MKSATEPLALALYRRHLRGESIEQLADDIGIPTDRVERRLRVAALYCSLRSTVRRTPSSARDPLVAHKPATP